MHFLFFLLLVDPVLETQINLAEELEIYSKHVTFAVSDTGALAFLDTKENQVVFRKGDTVHRAGRRGKGPREFSHLVSVLWDANQSAFLVFDTSNSRMSTWSEAGQFIAETRMPTQGNGRDFQITPSHSIFYTDSYESSLYNQHYLYFKTQPDSQAEIVWKYEFPPEWKPTNIRPGSPRPYIIFMHWDVDLRYAVGSNFTVVWPHNDQLQILDLKGQPTQQTLRLTMPRFPVTEEQVETMIGVLRNEEMRNQTRRHVVVPDVWPAVKHLVVDENDRIWVFGFPAKVHGLHPFQVMTLRGEVLDKGQVPQAAQSVRGNRLYASYFNSDDEGMLDVYHLKPQSAP